MVRSLMAVLNKDINSGNGQDSGITPLFKKVSVLHLWSNTSNSMDCFNRSSAIDYIPSLRVNHQSLCNLRCKRWCLQQSRGLKAIFRIKFPHISYTEMKAHSIRYKIICRHKHEWEFFRRATYILSHTRQKKSINVLTSHGFVLRGLLSYLLSGNLNICLHLQHRAEQRIGSWFRWRKVN